MSAIPQYIYILLRNCGTIIACPQVRIALIADKYQFGLFLASDLIKYCPQLVIAEIADEHLFNPIIVRSWGFIWFRILFGYFINKIINFF